MFDSRFDREELFWKLRFRERRMLQSIQAGLRPERQWIPVLDFLTRIQGELDPIADGEGTSLRVACGPELACWGNTDLLRIVTTRILGQAFCSVSPGTVGVDCAMEPPAIVRFRFSFSGPVDPVSGFLPWEQERLPDAACRNECLIHALGGALKVLDAGGGRVTVHLDLPSGPLPEEGGEEPGKKNG